MTDAGTGAADVKAGPVADAVVNKAAADDPAGLARRILGQLLLAKAAGLSREGRYREAEGLLDQENGDAPTLDLLARIRAQEGRLRDAEIFWRRALELDPGNETYIAALRRISMISLTSWARYAPYLAMGLLIAISIFLTGLTVSIYTKKQSANTFVSDTVNAQRPFQAIPGIHNIRGIVSKQEKNHTLLTFSSGLFVRNDRLTPEAKLLLSSLAKHLEPHAGSISVTITGIVDDAPMPAHGRYADNAALGMARALKVVEHMRNSGRLPADMFVISGQAEIRDLGPGASAEERSRNHSVVVRITGR
jgi:flagellar motor protein MotB